MVVDPAMFKQEQKRWKLQVTNLPINFIFQKRHILFCLPIAFWMPPQKKKKEIP